MPGSVSAPCRPLGWVLMCVYVELVSGRRWLGGSGGVSKLPASERTDGIELITTKTHWRAWTEDVNAGPGALGL